MVDETYHETSKPTIVFREEGVTLGITSFVWYFGLG